jgi:hypothetical protein
MTTETFEVMARRPTAMTNTAGRYRLRGLGPARMTAA